MCPYCGISFKDEPWASKGQPKVVCMNCRNYAMSIQSHEEFDRYRTFDDITQTSQENDHGRQCG